MKDIRSFFGRSTIVKSSRPLNSKEKKIIKIVWRKLNVYILSNWLHCHWVALQRVCKISLKGRKIHWKKCNLEFRKCGIKDCEWSKIPEKCGIKECEFWTKFAFFNSAFFCSAGPFSALLYSLKVDKNEHKRDRVKYVPSLKTNKGPAWSLRYLI